MNTLIKEVANLDTPNDAFLVSIQALEDIKTGLAAFNGDARASMSAMEQEISRTVDWLSERLRYWQMETKRRAEVVAQAQAALAACRSRGNRAHTTICVREEQAVLTASLQLRRAEAELRKVQHWHKLIQRSAEEYRRQVLRLKTYLESDLEKAKATLGQEAELIRAYSASGINLSVLNAEASLPPASGSPPSSKQATQIQNVPLSHIVWDTSHVSGSEDFQKTSYDEMADGCRRLEDVIRPNVENGASAEYFSALDQQLGLDYAQGYRKIFDVFYGDRPIKVTKVGEHYKVERGYHRIYVASQLGLASVPAHVVVPSDSSESQALPDFPVTPPESREGNIGGPERRG